MKRNEQSYFEAFEQWLDGTKEIMKYNNISPAESKEWERLELNFRNLKKDIHSQNFRELHEEARLFVERLNAKIPLKNSRARVHHTLPALPYSYDALEPYISEEIMRLHHSVHHQAYVDGLNLAEEMIYQNDLEPSELRHWLREQAFNGSGHVLHSIFWTNMTPFSSSVPIELERDIIHSFGSFNDFKKLFTNVASAVEGPGWAVLLYDPIHKRLLVESIEKHQHNQLANVIPLLVLDMWEHAYYLQYKTNKADYINQWWNVVNWQDVNNRLVESKRNQ